MIDTLHQAVLALRGEAALYSEGVRLWMRVMALSFFAGIAFCPWWREARWIVLTMVATAALLVIAKSVAPALSRSLLGSGIHVFLWPIALWASWAPAARRRRAAVEGGTWTRVFRAWLLWVSILMLVSLALDLRFLLSRSA